jgi:hypothetical protein
MNSIVLNTPRSNDLVLFVGESVHSRPTIFAMLDELIVLLYSQRVIKGFSWLIFF